MSRLQPVFPLLKNNFNRRRSRTWQILGLIVLLFLTLTFLAVRYLPTVVIDPVSVLKNGDFKDIFVPPIPRPPVHCSLFDKSSSRLDVPLFDLLLDEQVPVKRHEELPEDEMPPLPRDGRAISSSSQLSQSSTRTNETQSKPIRRDELILHA